MNKESLIKAREIIIKNLSKLKIDKHDKAELMLNLFILLDSENYDKDINILIKNRRK